MFLIFSSNLLNIKKDVVLEIRTKDLSLDLPKFYHQSTKAMLV